MKYLIIPLFFIFTRCQQDTYSVTVFNNSDKDLYFRVFSDSGKTSFNYYLKKNHETEVAIGNGKQEKEILDNNPSEKNVSVVYFDSIEEINPDTNFDQIKLKNCIVKKYSKQDLEKLDWKINYK